MLKNNISFKYWESVKRIIAKFLQKDKIGGHCSKSFDKFTKTEIKCNHKV